MAAGGLPTVQVLLDDGTGTFPYDISSKCRIGYDLNRGRQDEQSDVTPGAIRSLVLDNTDGRFTLNSTIIATPSPIRADNRIRVKVTPSGGTTRNRFTGYVQEWPTEWPDGSDLLCEVTVAATDAQARAERRELGSIIEEEIRLDNPIAYYVFGEAAGSTSAGDESGNQAGALPISGSGAAVVFGNATGPGTDGDTAAQLAGGKYFAALGALAGLASPYTVEVFFSASAAPAANGALVTLGANGTRRTVLEIHTDSTLGAQDYDDTGAPTLGYNSGGSYTDGQTHHLGHSHNTVGGTSRFFLDGTDLLDLVETSSTAPITDVWVGGYSGGSQVSAAVAHLAIFGSALAPARVTAHAQAGQTGFAGESGTARLTRLAAYVGIPVGTLDASLTNVPFKDITGSSAADAMRDVAAAEFGIVFIDGSGNLAFHNRNRMQGATSPDITLTADQVDPDTLVPVDMYGVVNYFEATAAGGTGAKQVVWNKVSERGDGTVTNPGHGRYPGNKAYLVQSDQEALDRANWIVANHADPLPRVPVLKVDLLTLDAATQNALLAAEADTWIRITGLPSQTAGGTTADLLVQGFAERMAPDTWELSFNVIAQSLFRAWILGDTTYGVLGSTTRLAV